MRPHAQLSERRVFQSLALLGGCALLDIFARGIFFPLGIVPSFFFASLGVAAALPIDLIHIAVFVPIFFIVAPFSLITWVYAAVVLAASALSFAVIRKYLAPGSYQAAALGAFLLSFVSAGIYLALGLFLGGQALLSASNIFGVLLDAVLTGILACAIRAIVYAVARY
jgi:hypothetical protein